MNKSVFKLALPTMLDQLSLAIVGFVTIKIVSGLGNDAIAGVVAAERVFFVLAALMFSISNGAMVLVSQAWGAKNSIELDSVVKVSLCISLSVALTLCAISFSFADAVISVFKLDPVSTGFAVDFIQVIAPFFLAYAITSVFSASLRATGDSWTPLKINVLGNVMNIVLAYLLVYGGGIVPRMEVSGAALANGVSFAVCALIYLLCWINKRLKFQPLLGNKFLEKTRVYHLLNVSLPIGVELLLFNFGMAFFTYILSFYGSITVAAFGVIIAITNIIYIVGMASSIATASVVGQLIGAKDFGAVTSTVMKSLAGTVATMTILATVLILLKEPIALFMNVDTQLSSVFYELLLFHSVMLPLLAVEFVFRGAYRGAGQPRVSMNITLICMAIRCGLVGLAPIFDLSLYFVYGALFGDYLVRASAYFYRFFVKNFASPIQVIA